MVGTKHQRENRQYAREYWEEGLHQRLEDAKRKLAEAEQVLDYWDTEVARLREELNNLGQVDKL